MDIDLSGVWTWAVPLWSLIALIFFLIGVQTQDIIYPVHTGGGHTGGYVKEANPRTKTARLR